MHTYIHTSLDGQSPFAAWLADRLIEEPSLRVALSRSGVDMNNAVWDTVVFCVPAFLEGANGRGNQEEVTQCTALETVSSWHFSGTVLALPRGPVHQGRHRPRGQPTPHRYYCYVTLVIIVICVVIIISTAITVIHISLVALGHEREAA